MKKSFFISKLFRSFASIKNESNHGITKEVYYIRLIGKVGTPKRDAYEEELKLYAIGAAIKQTRKQQNLTQEDLGQMVGVLPIL